MRNKNLPEHIDRANIHTNRCFEHFMRDYNSVKKYLDCTPQEIDRDLAYRTFDEICFQAIFDNSAASNEELTDPAICANIWSDVLRTWPETYYLELYVKHGIAYKFKDGEEVVYGLKENHSAELSRLLTAKSTK